MNIFTALPWLAGYYLVINLIAFLAFGWDKLSAIQGWWRTPERTLFTLIWLGGFAGALVAMLLFRHKTQHPAFYRVIGAAFVLHLLIWIFLPRLLRG